MDYQKLLNELLTYTAEKKASDLHLSPGYPPAIRLHGQLTPLNDYEVLDGATIVGLTEAALGNYKARFLAEKEVDFSYSLGEARFRTNVYITKGLPAATFRFLSSKIPSIEELNLPPVVKIFSQLKQGFVLVVGPNGQGKTTAMASLIDLINHERGSKIVTIEDPIEYIYKPDKSIIDQREVLNDTLSFHKALRSTFRQNVDVILVGEMRDLETMSAAVTAAETGHLVFTSLHTNNAAQTVERIIDSFPADQQPQIRVQLANTLSGIVSRRLIPNLKGGISPAAEVLIANSAIRNLIRENRLNQINLVIETSFDEGMKSFNRSLAELVMKNEISEEQAEFYSLDPAGLKDLLR
ncbi:MAG: twitching motility protein PilT [Parcubacteria group bacterium Gr01-1014_2]|nr:MAG: twitching motility protein PilT [Parcubacteria group bacterium Gr01-1014_2]